MVASLRSLLVQRIQKSGSKRGLTAPLAKKGGLNMDPAFILLSLWFFGAAVEFCKGDD